jgi:hypothetical protein
VCVDEGKGGLTKRGRNMHGTFIRSNFCIVNHPLRKVERITRFEKDGVLQEYSEGSRAADEQERSIAKCSGHSVCSIRKMESSTSKKAAAKSVYTQKKGLS